MKKLTLSLMVASVVLVGLLAPVSLPVAQAQTLTRADVQRLAPSIVALLNGLQSALSKQQRLVNSQNVELRGIAGQLAVVNSSLGALSRNQNLTESQRQAQLDSIGQIVSNVARRVTEIQNQRIIFNATAGGIVQTLSGIIATISQEMA
ncbi:MAG: hypothetical protein WC640_03055 [Candidatus Paceibacterota bacterium]|jgi:TolA-binding protein